MYLYAGYSLRHLRVMFLRNYTDTDMISKVRTIYYIRTGRQTEWSVKELCFMWGLSHVSFEKKRVKHIIFPESFASFGALSDLSFCQKGVAKEIVTFLLLI